MNRRAFLATGTLGLIGVGVGGCSTAARPAPPADRSIRRSSPSDRSVGRPSPADDPSAAPKPAGHFVHGSFTSEERGGLRTGWTIVYPPGTAPGDPLPVMVALHGIRGDNTSPFDEIHLDHFLAQAVHAGLPPYAIAGVDGGRDRFWHARKHENPGGMVVHEFIPLLRRHGLRTDRVALFGWSMGGHGALYLAAVLGRDRVACVGAESPAIWTSYADADPGAFDSAADYAAHSVFSHVQGLQHLPIRIDNAASETYAPAIAKLRREVTPRPIGRVVAGAGHDKAFWRLYAPRHIAFAGAHLS